ncbi:MAG: hypothetical protein JXM73_16445 [Anaerolineae bacterium]|nr:hypothetical protein [Anaerolineae bacterium]
MCCLITIASMLGPRLGILVWYLVNPLRWRMTFDTWVWPLLGSLFLPWTTLAYVLVAPHGIKGLEIVLLIIAVLVDLGAYGGGRQSQKSRKKD